MRAGKLSDAARNAALDNLANGNFTTMTAAQGQASRWKILQCVNSAPQSYP